jgi:hypothetical protein
MLIAPLIAGCGGGGGDAGTPVIGWAGRDSAGVLIVESREPLWPAGTGWRLSAAPELEIGVADGPVEYQFEEIAGLVPLSGGRWAVADGGASEVRVYDAAGRLIRAAGRPGDGPGEYRRLSAIGVGPGDTLWVYDFGTRRFTVLNPALLVARTVTLAGDLANVGGVALLPDGEFLVREHWSSRPATTLGLGLRRDPAAVARVDRAGRVRDTTVLVPGREVLISSEGGRAVMTAPLAARAASVAWAGDRVVVGDQSTFELRVYGLDGGLRRVVRRLGVDLRLDPGVVERALDARLASLPPDQRPARRIELEALPRPATRPAYGDVLVDGAGCIWAAGWVPAGDAPAWTVFDADGRLLGDVPIPPGFTPGWIGDDLMAGVQRDGLGVERVRVYRIERQ